jgi:hypothetical protein
MSRLRRLAFSTLLLAALAGCSKSDSKSAADAHAGHDHAAHKHEHVPPHGGTPVVLGNEAYHLELVREAATGKLSLYVMDGELENFVRINATTVEIVATVAGQPTPLVLAAVANPMTGEKTGDTSLFEATAEWLKTTPAFDAVLTRIEIRTNVYTAVAFNFPKGNDKD